MSLTNNGSPRDNTRESLPAPTNLLPPEERRSTEFYLLSFEILEGELEELIDRLQHDSAFMDLGDREPYEDRIGDIERELLARREERLVHDTARGRDIDPKLVPKWVTDQFPDRLSLDLEKCR
jgi:hypothetical protein